MSTSQIIWVIVLALVVIVLIGLAGYVMNKRKDEQNRSRAEGLRTEAVSGAAALPDAQVRAQEAEARAERARLQAEQAEADAARANQGLSAEQATYEDRIREADRLDPTVDHRSADYAPDTSTTEAEQPTYDAGGRVEPESSELPDTSKPTAAGPEATTAVDADGRPVEKDSGTHRA